MGPYLGDYKAGETVYFCWDTNDKDGGSVNRDTDGTINIYKDDDDSQHAGGITDSEAFDTRVGIHNCKIDLSEDEDFFAAGHDFSVILCGAEIDGETVNSVIATFSIENRFAGSVLFKQAAEKITDIKKLIRADFAIDKNKTPWVVDRKEEGTEDKLMSKSMYNTDGEGITSKNNVLGSLIKE